MNVTGTSIITLYPVIDACTDSVRYPTLTRLLYGVTRSDCMYDIIVYPIYTITVILQNPKDPEIIQINSEPPQPRGIWLTHDGHQGNFLDQGLAIQHYAYQVHLLTTISEVR
jgi:hypothetical protein